MESTDILRKGANDLVLYDDDSKKHHSHSGESFSVADFGDFLEVPTGLQFLFIPYGLEMHRGGYRIPSPAEDDWETQRARIAASLRSRN